MSQTDFGAAATTLAVTAPFVPPPSPPQGSNPPQRDVWLRRFTVDEYHRMGEIGVLRAGERVELLEGIVTMMSPIGAPHATCVELLNRVFIRLLPADWCYRSQHPVITTDSEPQPDGCVARGDLRTYGDHHPGLNEVVLAIEVADTSLSADRSLKSRIYAAADIPEYWIVNLIERKLEVHRRPIAAVGEQPARYEAVEVLGLDATVAVTLDGEQIGTVAVREILP